MSESLATALKQIVDSEYSGNQSEAARAFDMHRQDLNAVIKGKRGLTDPQVMVISQTTETSIGFWSELQRIYRLSKKDGTLPAQSPSLAFIQHITATGGGILVDTDIRQAIDSEFMAITPFNHENIQPASYDLTYGKSVYRTADGGADETTEDFDLAPGETVLIESNEHLRLNRQVLATIGNMTAWINKGIFFQRAAQVDPGYEGKITVRAENIGSESQTVHKAQPIMTLTFHFLTRAPTKDAPARKDAVRIFEELMTEIGKARNPNELVQDFENLLKKLKETTS